MHVRIYQLMQYFHTLTIIVPAWTITAHFVTTEGARNIHLMSAFGLGRFALQHWPQQHALRIFHPNILTDLTLLCHKNFRCI